MAEYDNVSTLLNVVRASRFEPLEFTSSGGIKGYNNFGTSIGLPTISFGPHGAGALGGARDYAITSGVTASRNSDFSVSTIDDPASYQALLSPLSPATIAFFIAQGYPRELLFHLLTERVSVSTPEAPKVFRDYTNEPFTLTKETASVGTPAEFNFECFASYVQYWTNSGLTVQIDRSTVPGAKYIPAHRMCFDHHLKVDVPLLSGSSGLKPGLLAVCPQIEYLNIANSSEDTRPSPGPDCDTDAKWTPAVSLDAAAPAPAAASAPAAGPRLAAAKPIAPAKPPPLPQAMWDLETGNGAHIRFAFRSAFGVYAFLGRMVSQNFDANFLKQSDLIDHALFTLQDSSKDCFTQISLYNRDWCVPNNANNSKKIFGLLRQIVRLNATPTVQTPTPTVRVLAQ